MWTKFMQIENRHRTEKAANLFDGWSRFDGFQKAASLYRFIQKSSKKKRKTQNQMSMSLALTNDKMINKFL